MCSHVAKSICKEKVVSSLEVRASLNISKWVLLRQNRSRRWEVVANKSSIHQTELVLWIVSHLHVSHNLENNRNQSHLPWNSLCAKKSRNQRYSTCQTPVSINNSKWIRWWCSSNFKSTTPRLTIFKFKTLLWTISKMRKSSSYLKVGVHTQLRRKNC